VAARLLGSRVRITLRAWMFVVVFAVRCIGSGLCIGPIIRSGEYVCVCVCVCVCFNCV
jgi:hypothetical protein